MVARGFLQMATFEGLGFKVIKYIVLLNFLSFSSSFFSAVFFFFFFPAFVHGGFGAL